MKFEENWPSGFRGGAVQMCGAVVLEDLKFPSAKLVSTISLTFFIF